MRAVQRARLCAITWTAKAPLAAKRPEGRWFNTRVILETGRDGDTDSSSNSVCWQ